MKIKEFGYDDFEKEKPFSSDCFTAYKEMQVHGEVSMEHDVAVLSVPHRSNTAPDDVKELVAKLQNIALCNVVWQGHFTEVAGTGRGGKTQKMKL